MLPGACGGRDAVKSGSHLADRHGQQWHVWPVCQCVDVTHGLASVCLGVEPLAGSEHCRMLLLLRWSVASSHSVGPRAGTAGGARCRGSRGCWLPRGSRAAASSARSLPRSRMRSRSARRTRRRRAATRWSSSTGSCPRSVGPSPAARLAASQGPQSTSAFGMGLWESVLRPGRGHVVVVKVPSQSVESCRECHGGCGVLACGCSLKPSGVHCPGLDDCLVLRLGLDSSRLPRLG